MALRDEFSRRVEHLERLAKAQLQQGPKPAPKAWAGSEPEEQAEEDQIDENGTDYKAVKKALADKVRASKSLTEAEVAIIDGRSPYQAIQTAISKGRKLTPAESWALKGGRAVFKAEDEDEKEEEKEEKDGEDEEKALDDVPEEKKDDEKDDEDKKEDAEKSFARSVQASDDLRGGFEASQFLAGLVRAIGTGLDGIEARTAKRIAKSEAMVAKLAASVDRLSKSLTKSNDLLGETASVVSGIGQFYADEAERRQQRASFPSGPPKAQQRAAAQEGAHIEKSGGSPLSGLSKSEVAMTMVDMIQKGAVRGEDVDRFQKLVLAYDMNAAQLTPDVQAAIANYRAAAGKR